MFGKRAVGDNGLQARFRALNTRADRPAPTPVDPGDAAAAAAAAEWVDTGRDVGPGEPTPWVPASALLDAPPLFDDAPPSGAHVEIVRPQLNLVPSPAPSISQSS